MKKIIFLFTILFFFTNVSISQEKGLLMTSIKYGKTDYIKENKRVRIKTSDGEIHKGRLKIIDNQTISIDGVNIALDSVVKIKRHSLTITIVATTLIVASTILFTTAMIYAEPIGQAIVGTFTALIAGSSALLPLIPNKHPSKKWKYSIEDNYDSQETDLLINTE